jgi:hypothetical protein|tara:strand:+ start:340 stop:558 length:219 start_codon:yes stop_codon:yes gene_type:complete
MILLKITEKEKPVILEALHFFGAEIDGRMKTMAQEDDLESWAEMMFIIDQIIDVIQLTEKKTIKLTDKKPVC